MVRSFVAVQFTTDDLSHDDSVLKLTSSIFRPEHIPGFEGVPLTLFDGALLRWPWSEASLYLLIVKLAHPLAVRIPLAFRYTAGFSHILLKALWSRFHVSAVFLALNMHAAQPI